VEAILIREILNAPPPQEIFPQVESRPYALWLDSGLRHPDMGRCSFIAIDPFAVLRGTDGRPEWLGWGGAPASAEDPLGQLSSALRRFRVESAPGLPPFPGGAAGFLGYELARDLERLPRAQAHDVALPDMELAFYDVVVGWNHRLDTCWIASTGFPEAGRARHRRAVRRLEATAEWLSGGAPPQRDQPLPSPERPPRTAEQGPAGYDVPGARGVFSTFTPDGYAETVRTAIELIRAGDIFQVNLSQRFVTERSPNPYELYSRLRERSPAPFGAFFRGTEGTILSTSPERFLRLATDGAVQARPIKGTRPRGRSAAEDTELAHALSASEKDRAENLMIVDLLRNDLSRVCRPGTVAATDLFRLESFATVHHLVSTVEGELKEGHGAVDLLRATFPCGSVTGAPKIRAMEVIAELEPVTRGPYCGAIGYIGFGGEADLSVAIRILVLDGKCARFHAGGAVVADSDPEAEYAETLDKARALMDALGEAW
jgi:para-aminobenzoate synthetase component 1